jgi:hypothetical protein
MPRTITLLLALLVTAAPVYAGQLKAPPIIPKDHGTVVTSTTKGIPRWSAHWAMEPWNIGGKNAVRFTETGKGHYSPFTQEIQWNLESVWLADGNFSPLQFRKTISDMQGHTLAIERKSFDLSGGIVKFERQNEKGVSDTSSFDAAPDILTIEGIAGILQSYPFGKSGSAATVNAHLLSNEPKLYDVSIEPRGTERLKTPSGEVECYKLEVVPHLGLLNLFRVFQPKTIFWFRVEAPHAWVRYQGLENGFGTPEIVMEAR